MTPLAELRKKHRESYEKAGLKLSYMPFIMKRNRRRAQSLACGQRVVGRREAHPP